MQNGTATLEDSLAVPYKTKHTFIIQYVNHFLVFTQTSWKLTSTQKNCTWMYTTSLFIIAKLGSNRSKGAFSRWLLHKLWYIQTIEYYSVIKRNELSSQEKTCSNLKCILLSERSLCEKATNYMIPTEWCSGKKQYYGESKNISGCKELAGREGWIDRVQRIF